MMETLITLREDDKLASISQRSNGIVVQDRKILIDQLLASFLDVMEDEEVLELLIQKNGSVHDALGEWILEQEPEQINKLFGLFLQRISQSYHIKKELDMKLFAGMFKEIANQFDLSVLSEESLNRLLQLLLDKVDKLEDPVVFGAMFVTLLNKVNIAEGSDQLVTQVLELALERTKREEDEKIIQQMFTRLAKKARQSWIRQVLAPFLKKKRVVKTPVLPKHCCFYQEELDGKQIVVIEVEKQQIDIDYHLSSFSKVGHPRMLFAFTVSGESILQCHLFCVKDAIIKPTTKLYRYPFSNVFPDGRTCWPELNSLRIQDIHQLSTLPYLFLRSPSNDHLYQGINLRDQYESLQQVDFDDDQLIPTVKTVESEFYSK